MIPDLINIFISIMYYFGYLSLVTIFCKNFLEIKKRNAKIWIVSLFFSRIFLCFINNYHVLPNIMILILEHIIFIGLLLLLFQGEIEKKILTSAILITGITLIENFLISLFSCLFLVYLHIVKNISIPVLKKWESNLIFYISQTIVILILYVIRKHLSSVFYCKSKKYYLTLAIPLFIITAVIDIANFGASHGILVKSEDMGIYYDQIFSYIEFCILTILSLFAAGFYIFGMNQIYLEQKKSEQYYAQITSYKILEEQYSQSKRLRHDLKNHILALLGLLKNKEWKKMEDYLNTMAYSANLGISEDLTGNKVVDILIYQKRNIAERKHFLWECDVQIPNLYCINEFDLCILFGNIVDNAIEACERLQENSSNNQQPFINIQSKIIKKCFLLEVKNSADTAKKTITSSNKKETIKEHGIGLLNIHDVVNKYNGVINIETKNNIFIISILIPLNHNEHDKK